MKGVTASRSLARRRSEPECRSGVTRPPSSACSLTTRRLSVNLSLSLTSPLSRLRLVRERKDPLSGGACGAHPRGGRRSSTTRSRRGDPLRFCFSRCGALKAHLARSTPRTPLQWMSGRDWCGDVQGHPLDAGHFFLEKSHNRLRSLRVLSDFV
jgi:hypothetical protein